MKKNQVMPNYMTIFNMQNNSHASFAFLFYQYFFSQRV